MLILETEVFLKLQTSYSTMKQTWEKLDKNQFSAFNH